MSLSLLVVAVIAGCGGGVGSHNYSKALSREISMDGTQRLRHDTNGVGGSGSAIINDVRCAQTVGTEVYSCVVRYTYQNSEGTYRYKVKVSATCDRGGKCRWHADGGGILIEAEPD